MLVGSADSKSDSVGLGWVPESLSLKYEILTSCLSDSNFRAHILNNSRLNDLYNTCNDI